MGENQMKKQLYTLALAGLSVICFSFASLATETISAPKSRNLTPEEVKEIVDAKAVDKDGNIVPLDVEATLTELPPVMTRNGEMGKQYSLEVRASTSKSESNTEDVNESNVGVQATGVLTMYWTDVTGIKNTMERLKGSWSVSEGTFYKGELKYGSDHNRPYSTSKVGSSIDKTISYIGNPLHAYYNASIQGDELVIAYLCVHPWF